VSIHTGVLYIQILSNISLWLSVFEKASLRFSRNRKQKFAKIAKVDLFSLSPLTTTVPTSQIESASLVVLPSVSRSLHLARIKAFVTRPFHLKLVNLAHKLCRTARTSSQATCTMSQDPRATPKQTGKCVVCLKETKTKCSSCAGNGIDWLYFCSQEHQKLVSDQSSLTLNQKGSLIPLADDQIWPLHKRVCGPRGRPWCWPALTKKEVQEMIELYDKPRKDHETGVVTTWRDHDVADMKRFAPGLVQRIDLSQVGVETFKVSVSVFNDRALSQKTTLIPLKTLTTPQELLANLLESSDGLPLAPSQYLGVICNRSQAWVSKSGSTYFDREPTMPEYLKLIARDPFIFLAHFEKVTAKLVLNDDKNSWWSDVQHKIVILLAFTVRSIQVPVLGPEYRENEVYRRNAYDEAVRYCKEVIEPDDADAAKEITSNIIKVLYFEHTQFAIYSRGDHHKGHSFEKMLCDQRRREGRS